MGIRNMDLDRFKKQILAVTDLLSDDSASAKERCADNHKAGCECWKTYTSERRLLLDHLRRDLDEALRELEKKGTSTFVAASKKGGKA